MNDRKVGIFVFSILVSLSGTLFISNAQAAPLLTPKEMMQKNDEARRVNDFDAKSLLTTGTEGSTSDLKIKEFTLSRKIQSDGVHNSTLTRFHTPAEVRNEGILIVENANGRNDVLMYLPNFKKVRRVESQQQSGSFMGSVFSYSDIATPHVDDFTYKLLREEKCPSAETATLKCSVIECTPVNDDVKERTGYSKSLIWIRADNFMSVHGEYFNLEGEYFKRLEATETKIIDAKNKKWLAHNLYITNLKTKEYTRLQFSDVKANKGIPDSTFTQQNLQKVN
jgi:outer membrane lipoprotein-sorting protein